MFKLIENIFTFFVKVHYANSLNALVLLGIFDVAFFYFLRGLIDKKITRKKSILRWEITAAGFWKFLILVFCISFSLYGILGYCPMKNTEPSLIPLYALYKFVMHGQTEPMREGMFNLVLMLPVGLWLGENMKAFRSQFTYKWASIVTLLVGCYLEYSQYELGIGKPSVDDVIFILLGVTGGIFFKDFYDKWMQMLKMVKDFLKNQARKKEKEKIKEEEQEREQEEKKALEAQLKEEEEEKQRLENEAKKQHRKELYMPYVEKVRASKIYQKAVHFFDSFILLLLVGIQNLAEKVSDKTKITEDDLFDEMEDPYDIDDPYDTEEPSDTQDPYDTEEPYGTEEPYDADDSYNSDDRAEVPNVESESESGGVPEFMYDPEDTLDELVPQEPAPSYEPEIPPAATVLDELDEIEKLDTPAGVNYFEELAKEKAREKKEKEKKKKASGSKKDKEKKKDKKDKKAKKKKLLSFGNDGLPEIPPFELSQEEREEIERDLFGDDE